MDIVRIVKERKKGDWFVNVEWLWHETCTQGYQKCDMRHVYRVIRNVTWDLCTGLSEMWHETCAQGYQKCDMRHMHQGYQKCDMIHVYRVIRNVIYVYRVIRNVTRYMCTGLSEMWHDTCAQGYQKSLFIMNNHLCFWGLYVYVYQATDTITCPLLSRITKFPLSHFTTQSLQ